MSRCLHLTKQKLTYSDWNSEEVREEQISNIVCGGMFGGLHPMLSLPMVTHLEVILGDGHQEGRLGHVSLP